MTELETIQRTKMYIDNLANGINPLNGQHLPEEDIVNNVRITRCLFYVSNVLQQVIQSSGIVGKQTKPKKQPFNLDVADRLKFEISETAIPVSEITKRINSLIDAETMMLLKYQSITGWLLNAGFLTARPDYDGKMKKYPTEAGNRIGIQIEHRIGIRGDYDVIVYSPQAQQFIVDNLDGIIGLNHQKPQKRENEESV